MEWSGVEWSGVEWSGVEWGGVEWSGELTEAVAWPNKGRHLRPESLRCQSEPSTHTTATNISNNGRDERTSPIREPWGCHRGLKNVPP